MGTKNNPGEFDCYAAAEPDEPMFVLLARDINAAMLVDMWAKFRKDMIRDGRKPNHPNEWRKVDEALSLARDMRAWRLEHRPTTATKP